MISLSINPIESLPFKSDESQTFTIGYNGTLSVNINGTTIHFHLGGEGESYKMCVEQAQAILYGISSECRNFAERIENDNNLK